MSSRTVAIKTLVAQHKSKEPFERIFTGVLDKLPLSEKDRQLAMAMALGVIRHRNELDFAIAAFATTPIAKMRLEVLTALRVGVMQLLFMDRIPPSAAVNETIKGMGKQPGWIKGFLNGVLREISRNNAKAQNILTTLSKQKKTNHPGWLVDHYIKQFGKETAFAICNSGNELPLLTLRINPRFCTMASFMDALQGMQIDSKRGTFTPHSVILLSPVAVDTLPGFDQGWFYIQDEAAQLIALFFAEKSSGLFLDGCAGLGGKTLLLDQTMPDTVEIHAIEPHHQRRKLFKQNMKRCQCRQVTLFAETLDNYAQQSKQQYDGILIDAPCSGLGVIRRHPDIRWNRTLADLNQFSTTQKNLLHQAAPLVKSGGFLVYVTCSTSIIENEQVIETFLKRHSEFSLEQPAYPETVAPFFTSGALKTLPHQGLDGFFAVKLRKDIEP